MIAFTKGAASPDLLRLQAVQKSLAERFFSWTDAHGLTAFLVCGSALGAVRHGDMIPWDDDIDIGMLRADFEKLVAAYAADPMPGIFLQHWKSEPGYPYAFAKLRLEGTTVSERAFLDTDLHQGIFVDIFPFDFLPASPLMQRIQQWCLLLISLVVMSYSRNAATTSRNRLLRWVRLAAWSIRSLMPVGVLISWRERLSNPGWLKRSESLACFEMWGIRFARRSWVPCSMLLPVRQLRFGELTVPVPGRVEEYLTQAYGDYGAFPPENQQRPLHITAVDFG